METYEAMRQFADSWALLAMVLFFLSVVVRVFSPRVRQAASEAAAIPFNETAPNDAADRRADGLAEE